MNSIKTEIDKMVDQITHILYLWMIQGDKKAVLSYFGDLLPYEQERHLKALKDVVGRQGNNKFKEAARAIHAYITKNLESTQNH